MKVNSTHLMNELTVIAVKRDDGLYHFDHSHKDTVEELLCNGTEKVIDDHFYFSSNRYAKAGDKIEISLFLTEPEDYDTLLTLQSTDDEGSVYLDTVLCDDVWLCPWLQGYFGYVPDEIYIKVRVINPGLEAFVERTGMKNYLK